jgi:hypothetical protein
MQECLCPAHGMHTGREPDFLGWGYPSEGGGLTPKIMRSWVVVALFEILEARYPHSRDKW